MRDPVFCKQSTQILYENFVEQFKSVFLEAEGKVQFVECPVRMGKTYMSERYIIDFLKSRKCEIENQVLIFATEKNLLVDMHV